MGAIRPLHIVCYVARAVCQKRCRLLSARGVGFNHYGPLQVGIAAARSYRIAIYFFEVRRCAGRLSTLSVYTCESGGRMSRKSGVLHLVGMIHEALSASAVITASATDPAPPPRLFRAIIFALFSARPSSHLPLSYPSPPHTTRCHRQMRRRIFTSPTTQRLGGKTNRNCAGSGRKAPPGSGGAMNTDFADSLLDGSETVGAELHAGWSDTVIPVA